MILAVVELSPGDLAIAASLVLVSAMFSLALGLGLERRLFWATVRTILQLLAVGYVLRWVFSSSHVAAIFAMVAVMVGAAGRAAIRRPSRTFRGAYWGAFFSLAVSGMVFTTAVTAVVLGVRPWYRPQVFIPLLGMALGNTLTGISLCLDSILAELIERRSTIEMELAHGATSWEASRGPMARAIRLGMIPIINSMMVVGLVSLPGMMTGQILAGEDPLNTVYYQMVVMFMLAGATAFGSTLIALVVFRRFFNDRHQLKTEGIFIGAQT